jgi:hypothetical protein
MLFYGLQVGNVVALERTFEVTSCGSRYEVYIEAPDTWQFGTQLEVKTRLTLIHKRVGDSQVEYVTNASRAHSESLRVHVSESSAVLLFGEEGNHPENPFSTRKDCWEFVNLTKDGDYWETQLLLEMGERNEGRLERGESTDTVLVVYFTLDAFGANHTKISESFIVGTLSLSDDDQILLTVFGPSFFSTEIYAAVGGCAIIVLGLVMFVMERVGWVSFGFLNAFSKFANKYPLLVHVVSTFFLVVLGVAFIPVLISLSIMFSGFLLLALIFEGVFVVSSIILAVGLLEFILRDWKFLTISVGFLLALFVTYLIYIALDFLILGP